ncbi:MAG: tetratricopeptide repeat protein [Bacteroidaceae bacterium]|nr:tetratricopeptide repeat protein [Bacteroidaceae bacterium]
MLNITSLIHNPQQLNEETLPELKELVEKYPFYQTARLLYITNLFLSHHPDFGGELRKSSIFLADRSALFRIVENANYDLQQTPKSNDAIETESDINRTMSVINTFLSNSHPDEKGKKTPSIADLTNDYTAFLENMDDIVPETAQPATQQGAGLNGGELIDAFIESTKGKQRYEMEELGDDYTSPQISYEEEEIYTENMVNIYIKQGRYKQALEILRKICLNNPKKSANFAAQIQLLEVILAEKS